MKRAPAIALLAVACASAPPPPPEPATAEPWCAALERFLGSRLRAEGDFSCASVSALVLGGPAEASARASVAGCSRVKVSERELRAGSAFRGEAAPPDLAAVPWLAQLLRDLPPDPKLEIRLEQVELRELRDLPRALGEAASQGECIEQRGAICQSEAPIVDAIVVASPVVVVSGDRPRTLRPEGPVVIAARSATPGLVLGDRAACRGAGGRAPTAAERSAFRDFAGEMGYAFLRSVQCQMLELSPPMLNSLCGGKPCTTMRLFYDVYRHPLSELHADQRDAVCSAIQSHPGFSACGIGGAPGAFVCAALAPWLEKNGGLPWCEIGLSGCSDGILAGKHVPTQIAIFSHVLARATPTQRDCMLGQLLATWKGYDPRPWKTAADSWSKLASRCEPAGCDFGIARTEQPAGQVERALLDRLLSHFSKPGSIEQNPGCESVWLSYDKSWSVARGGSTGLGMSPAPPERLHEAALGFANQIAPR